MRKTLFNQLNKKANLNQSVEMEDELDKEDLHRNLKEKKTVKLNFNLDIDQKKYLSLNNNIKIVNADKSNNGSVVNLDVNRINKVFINRYPTIIPDLKDEDCFNNEFNSVTKFNHNDSNNEISILLKDANDSLNNINQDSNTLFTSNQNLTNKIFTLPKSKNSQKIFEEFLSIGIENTGLEYITDIYELYMTPKILYNFPNKLQESEIKFNIKFLKNFCFNEGVKVQKFDIKNEEDYVQNIFEKNFFSKNKLSFCLLQQVTTEDIEKYFIFGIKFDDFYIVDSGLTKSKTIFVYEKTYLFIANEPLCKLFEVIFQHILNVKKLNFFKNLDNFDFLFSKESVSSFEKENNEKVKLKLINRQETK